MRLSTKKALGAVEDAKAKHRKPPVTHPLTNGNTTDSSKPIITIHDEIVGGVWRRYHVARSSDERIRKRETEEEKIKRLVAEGRQRRGKRMMTYKEDARQRYLSRDPLHPLNGPFYGVTECNEYSLEEDISSDEDDGEKEPLDGKEAQRSEASSLTEITSSSDPGETSEPETSDADVPNVTRNDILAEEYGWEPGHRVFGPSGNIPLTVCNILGNGSLGIVEEVKAKGCQHRSFVRKTVQLPFHKRRERLNIIQEEAHILQKLTHSHIVSILGSYEDSIQVNRRFYCLLMLPVGENDLKTFLEIAGDAKTVNTQWQGWIWRWFGCLASALAYMHSEGVRHQDIKPSNIIHNGGDIYFTDFSSSSRFEIGQTTSTENPSRSSAMYGAPEVVDTFYDNGSLQRHGRGSDIFALGCVFCEMLTVAEGGSVSSFHEHLLSESIPGNRLGPGASAARGMLLYSRKTGQIRDWFKSSIFFVECISAMLSFDRGSRPSAANIVEKVLKTQSCQSECVCHIRPRISLQSASKESVKETESLHQPPHLNALKDKRVTEFGDADSIGPNHQGRGLSQFLLNEHRTPKDQPRGFLQLLSDKMVERRLEQKVNQSSPLHNALTISPTLIAE